MSEILSVSAVMALRVLLIVVLFVAAVALIRRWSRRGGQRPEGD